MNKKILVVDDDRHFNLLLATRLKKSGLEVIQAYSAAECITLCGKHKPDLVIADVKLQDKHGVELVQELKSRKIKTRIVLLSGLDLSREEVAQAKQAGASAYIGKSERMGDIIGKIESVLKSDDAYNV